MKLDNNWVIIYLVLFKKSNQTGLILTRKGKRCTVNNTTTGRVKIKLCDLEQCLTTQYEFVLTELILLDLLLLSLLL